MFHVLKVKKEQWHDFFNSKNYNIIHNNKNGNLFKIEYTIQFTS